MLLTNNRFSTADDVLLFFKHYDPVEKTLSCVGHFYTPLSTKFGKGESCFNFLDYFFFVIILLNLAEYRLILANSACGLVG